MPSKFLCFMFLVAALADNFKWTSAEPTWTSLRVTWGLNIFSSRVFAKLPRTEDKARRHDFAKLAGDCTGKFLGRRYIKGLDTATVVLYDKNGYVAGMQSGIPKSQADKFNTTFSFADSPAFQLDRIGEEEIYFATVYFVDPKIICSKGRSQAQYYDQGTGNGLYLQNGSNPIYDSVPVPLYEKDVPGTKWVKGGCFRSMGVHYWYGMDRDFDCRKMFPYTAIYNRGKLTSFAFAFPGNYKFSKRFEHPPKSAFEKFLPSPVPKCLYDEYDRTGGFSTIHVFFSVRPWNIFC